MRRFVLTAALTLAIPVAASPLWAQTAAAKPATAAKPAAGRVIDITGSDDMKFSIPQITAKPGEAITIRLKNVGTLPKIAMAHNVVVLKATAKAADFANASAMARDTEFIPAAQKADVIAHTPLAGPGETVEISFKAPAAGSYPFLCSFPGHFAAGMKGTLVVK